MTLCINYMSCTKHRRTARRYFRVSFDKLENIKKREKLTSQVEVKLYHQSE